jgi:hypothetical protein
MPNYLSNTQYNVNYLYLPTYSVMFLQGLFNMYVLIRKLGERDKSNQNEYR